MTQETFNKKVKKILNSKPAKPPKFCEVCGTYSSKKHQDIWCAHCPGKMKEYPKMSIGDCVSKSKKHGSGWINTVQYAMGVFTLKEFCELWDEMGGTKQLYIWCEKGE